MSISYKNPPIKEAVLDLKFVFEKEISSDLFEEVYKILQKDYPKKETLNMQTVAFKIGNAANGESNELNSQHKLHGIRLTSINGLHIVQLKTDGITFSRIEPYKGWDSFLPEAEKVIQAYTKVLTPKYISRLALRFINLINIPETSFDLSDYFVTQPQLAANIKASIKHFFMRQVIESNNDGLIAILNQTTANNPTGSDNPQIVFDIDVFKDNVKLQFSSSEYKNILDSIRSFRSEIFEESLTQKTKDLFN